MLSERNKQILIVGTLGAVILFALLGYVYFMNIRGELADGDQKRAQIAKATETMRGEIRRYEEFIDNEDERERMEEIIAQAKERLPDDAQAIEFRELLQEALERTGVAFTFLDQEDSEKRNLYEEIPYKVAGRARYHDFGQFVNLIECHPNRFMRIKGFSLKSDTKRPSVHVMDVGISTFRFLSR